MSGLNNVRVKGTPVEVGGKTLYLKYDLNAFAALEDKYGSMDKVFKAVEGEVLKDEDGKVLMTKDEDGEDVPRRSFSFKLVRTLLWAGLMSGDESLTEWQVGAMLEPSKLGTIMESATKAIEAALPELSDEEKAKIKAERKIKETSKPGGADVVKNSREVST